MIRQHQPVHRTGASPEDGGCDALLTLRFTEQVREGESGLDELFEATFLNYLVDGDKLQLSRVCSKPRRTHRGDGCSRSRRSWKFDREVVRS